MLQPVEAACLTAPPAPPCQRALARAEVAAVRSAELESWSRLRSRRLGSCCTCILVRVQPKACHAARRFKERLAVHANIQAALTLSNRVIIYYLERLLTMRDSL